MTNEMRTSRIRCFRAFKRHARTKDRWGMSFILKMRTILWKDGSDKQNSAVWEQLEFIGNPATSDNVVCHANVWGQNPNAIACYALTHINMHRVWTSMRDVHPENPQHTKNCKFSPMYRACITSCICASAPGVNWGLLKAVWHFCRFDSALLPYCSTAHARMADDFQIWHGEDIFHIWWRG